MLYLQTLAYLKKEYLIILKPVVFVDHQLTYHLKCLSVVVMESLLIGIYLVFFYMKCSSVFLLTTQIVKSNYIKTYSLVLYSFLNFYLRMLELCWLPYLIGTHTKDLVLEKKMLNKLRSTHSLKRSIGMMQWIWSFPYLHLTWKR